MAVLTPGTGTSGGGGTSAITLNDFEQVCASNDGGVTAITAWRRWTVSPLGVITSQLINDTGAVLAGYTQVACERPILQSYIEFYRLAGNIPGTALPEIVNVPGVANSTMVIGNTVTLTGDRLSMSIVFLPATELGSRLEVNGRGYVAGAGPVYAQFGAFSDTATGSRTLAGDVTVTTFATDSFGSPAVSYVELAVERPL